MPVVARNVDDRRDGNEWKFVTRSHGSFRSGVVGNGAYILFHRDYESVVLCCCGIYLGRAGHTLEFPFRRNGAGDQGWSVDPSKKKNWKDQGVGHEFCSVNRENLWDRYVCVRCVRTTSFLSLFVSFFDKWWPIIFFPRGAKVSVFWRSWFGVKLEQGFMRCTGN